MNVSVNLLGYRRKSIIIFLRDVSDFLNDTRLIHNTFNEFVIYFNEIGDPDVEPTCLFAFMLYKNVFGRDFEALHDKKGAFFSVIERKDKLIEERVKQINLELENVEENINLIKQEVSNTEYELISSYVGELLRISNGYGLFCLPDSSGSSAIKLTNIKTFEDIKPLISANNLRFSQNSNVNFRISNCSFKSVENNIDPESGIEEKIKRVLDKVKLETTEFSNQILTLKEAKNRTERLSISDLLNDSPDILDKLPSELDTDDINHIKDENSRRLFRFLLFSGYLNENYSFYTSIFREQENWTANDRLFNTTLKSRDVYNPLLNIDNPQEVCARLNKIDFSTKYVLNIQLFDYLLSTQFLFSDERSIALAFLQRYYEKDFSQDFISAYLKQGKKLKELFTYMLINWPKYIETVLLGNEKELHLSKLLFCAEPNLLIQNGGNF
ncbi:YobI family P-loop NTPase, partial [Aliiglaciecola lipolytica]|uniref:YobI family P-loop NTPase n=1 Tax=Aliiglaciecola lipolytica TaxID=477689 RepID=UPI001375BAAD